MARLEAPQKLNICITTQKFPLLGRADNFGFLWPISKGLIQKGHRVTVLSTESPQHSPEIQQEGVRAFFLKENQQYRGWNFQKEVEKKFTELHETDPFNILHSIDHSGLNIALKKEKFNIATAFDVNSIQMSQLFAILGMNRQTLSSLLATGINLAYKYLRTYFGYDRQVLKSADGVFVSSPIERVALERYYYYPDARIHTVPYGTDIIAHDDRNIEELRKKWNLSTYNQCIVTVSNMEELDEIKNLLLAFEKVVIKKPDLRFIIIGNGPMRTKIEYQIYSLALGSKVILTGAVNNMDLPDFIALSSVFINITANPSGFESSLFEAMMQKKIIIGSEISAITSVVQDGIDGFLVRPADINSISKLMFNIFNGQIDVSQIGLNAQKKIADFFDSKKMIDATLKAYARILWQSGIYNKSKIPHYWT